MTSIIRIALAIAVLALPARLYAASCPTNVVYEPTGVGSVDAGWTGVEHDLPLVGPTLNLQVACGPTSPPCGTCAITGILGLPLRCEHETWKSCFVATEASDCGAPGSCRIHLAPPQSVPIGFTSLCMTTTVDGPVGGTIDIESGAFAPTVPVQSNVYPGVGTYQGCPRCVGDGVANDGIRNGTCDAGTRSGFPCDANATSGIPDLGSTSFDCPLSHNAVIASLPVRAETSTGVLSRTLGPDAPRCWAFGGGVPCFCGQCNDAAGEACFTNADCPPSGGNPGICGGRRCIGGTNHGTPCTANSECSVGGLCGRAGEPTKPDACLDDTTGDDCVAVGGEGECLAGPVNVRCANHPNRQCVTDADCDGVSGACQAKNRACFLDNGLDGASIGASGTATAPVDGIADPVDLAILGCVPASGSASLNNHGGFPGLVRGVYPGRLRIVDPAATPTPPVPTATVLPTPIPQPCSAAPALCRPPSVGGKSSVQLVDSPFNDKDRLQWKWSKGTATTRAELGDPLATDEYALCLYEGLTLRATMLVPPGGSCNRKPCWRSTSKGYDYKNGDALPDGITQLSLRAGAEGKASILAKGRGTPLPMPALGSLTGAIRVQLRNRTSGLCWDAVFAPPFQKHTADQLKDRDD